MASLNKKRITNSMPKKDMNTTLNHEGMVVHQLNALEELYNRARGSFFGESGFYHQNDPISDFEHIKELIESIPQEDAEYIMKIAAIGRAAGMISYPLAILTACFNDAKFRGNIFTGENGKNKSLSYAPLVVRRGKDITEILSMQKIAYPNDKLPAAEKKALKNSLESFDEYQIAKALGKSRAVSMADAIKMLHPANKNEFFKSVIEGNVRFANGKKQVQAEIAKANNSNSESTKKDIKESIADSSLIATLKNIIALNRAGSLDAEVTEIICNKLRNSELVRASKVMPYEIYATYLAVCERGGREMMAIRNALSKALDASLDNIADIEGYNAIFVDMSGSMGSHLSSRSSITLKQMACLLAAMAAKKTNARIYAFANLAKEVIVSRDDSVLSIMREIQNTEVGGSTYLMEALRAVQDSGEKFDNVIVLSDGDAYSRTSNSFVVHSYSRFARQGENCDDVVNNMIANGTVKRFFINDLDAENFAIVDTSDYRKNLVTGFTERYIDDINATIELQKAAGDIKVLIDMLFDRYYGNAARTAKKKK